MKKTIAATAATTMKPTDIMNQMSRATTKSLSSRQSGRKPRRELSGPTGRQGGSKQKANPRKPSFLTLLPLTKGKQDPQL
jgi:cbb3-type cytochrome oxidase subunit 3